MPGEPGASLPPESGLQTVESIAERVRVDPDALLCDEVLTFAVGLDRVTLERLRKRLSKHARTADLQAFVRAVRARAAERTESRRSDRARRDERPRIVITTEEGEVNDRAVAALATLPGIYSRMGSIVRVLEVSRRRPGEARPYSATEIRMVEEPLLRELLSRAGQWLEPKETPDGDVALEPAHPPEWSVRAVHARGEWPELAPLYHVATEPVILPDGRILRGTGYDADTGILCASQIDVDVPEALTRTDSRSAGAEILELVAEVPFENDAHRSAWLAALLSVVGRWAFRGQCPLFMLDANKEGTGKGFLVGIISGISIGRPCDITVQTADEEEERKFITSKVLTGQPLVLIDEVDKPFGSGAIQAILTSGVWAPRLLGTNDSPSFAAYIVWIAAGNNVQLKSGDIARRTCFVRIVTELDNPAERTGFKIDDMEGHVRANRARLFRACLIMLRAWLRAEMKPEELEGWGGRWGSFDDWDRVVRGAIVYAGLADPKGAKATAIAPSVKEGLADVVLGLEELLVKLGGEGSATAIHDALAANDTQRREAREAWGTGVPVPTVAYQTFRKGLASMLPHLRGATPTAQQIGNLLGKNQAQAVPSSEGRKWIRYRRADGGAWRVELVPPPKVAVAEPLEDEPEERAAIQGEEEGVAGR